MGCCKAFLTDDNRIIVVPVTAQANITTHVILDHIIRNGNVFEARIEAKRRLWLSRRLTRRLLLLYPLYVIVILRRIIILFLSFIDLTHVADDIGLW